MSNALSTIPPVISMTHTAIRSIEFDFAPLIQPGEIPSLERVTLTDLGSNRSYVAGLLNAPALVAGVVSQVVWSLHPGHVYRLAATVLVDDGKSWTQEVDLRCAS